MHLDEETVCLRSVRAQGSHDIALVDDVLNMFFASNLILGYLLQSEVGLAGLVLYKRYDSEGTSAQKTDMFIVCKSYSRCRVFLLCLLSGMEDDRLRAVLVC